IDMAMTNTRVWALSEDHRQQLEAWLVDFDQAWDEDRLPARLAELPPGHPLRLPALIEMAKIDLEHRWQRGRREGVEDSLRRFPELGTSGTVSVDLLQAEYEIRQHLGDPAALTDLERRFPTQAGALRQLVEQGSVASTGPPTRATPIPVSSTFPGP